MNEVLPTFEQQVETARIKLQRIEEAIQTAAPTSNPIRIVGASKAQSVDAIRTFSRAGFKRFGENYLQEAETKMTALKNEGIEWHFIGRIQSRKAKQIATQFSWVQSIDGMRIAQRLSRFRELNRPNDPLNCCIQVNIDHEPQKAGINPDLVHSLVAVIRDLPGLKLRGLMAIPAPQTSQALQIDAFNRVRELFDSANPRQPEYWDTLSMGMSGDYPLAVRLGSTMVRLGTSLFGPRESV